MSVKIDLEGPRRSKKDPVRLRKLRQTSQAAFAASSFSSWFISRSDTERRLLFARAKRRRANP